MNKQTTKGRRQTQAKGLLAVNGVLNAVLTRLGLDQRLKEHALMNLWPALVGDLLAGRSRCLYFDRDKNLVVAVRDSATMQELTFVKRKLFGKLSCLAPSLGVTVSGLRFDIRQWQETANAVQAAFEESPLPKPSEAQLMDVKLSQSDRERIAELKVSLDNNQNNPALAARILVLFEKELRLSLWRRQNGYPVCPECNIPQARLCGSKGVCAVCFCASS